MKTKILIAIRGEPRDGCVLAFSGKEGWVALPKDEFLLSVTRKLGEAEERGKALEERLARSEEEVSSLKASLNKLAKAIGGKI